MKRFKFTLNKPVRIQAGLSLAVSLALIACGSGNNSQELLDHTELSELSADGGKLVKTTAEQAELTIKNGVFLSNNQSRYYSGNCNTCDFAVEAVADSSASDGAAEDDSSNFSSTTTQEEGVAESDRVKYDGNRLFLASNNDYGYYYTEERSDDDESSPELNLPHVRVLERQSDDSLVEQATVPTSDSAYNLSDLYLHQNRMMTIYNTYETVSEQTNASSDISSSSILTVEPYWYSHNSFGVNINDVTTSNEPTELVKYNIEGYIQNSRRIENKVYIVSQYTPQLFIDYPSDASYEDKQVIYHDIVNLDTQDILPNVRINGGDPQLLVQAEQCFLPENAQDIHGFTQITTVTTFDLDNPNDFQSICVIAPLSGLYASTNNIYLYGSVYKEESSSTNTIIHQFSYNEDSVDYVASGEIEGHVSWNNSHLRFSEKDDYLRVITSQSVWTGSQSIRDHQLFVLKANDSQSLEQIAKLPNDERPAAIGKPDEDIYAVRYYGDKAYVVTFRRTDPLYVIDLNNPEAPFIAGELEIPGYSSYLQPLSENFVLGIGQQVDPNAGFGLEPFDPNQTSNDFVEGAKAELYDVSDPSNPTVAATLVYEGVYSVAEWDYHALTQLKLNDTEFKFAFPLSGWSQVSNDQGGYTWQYHQSLQMIEVDLENSGQLTNIGNLSPDAQYTGRWGDRSVLHGDIVYYIRHNKVWQSYWSNPTVINGDY